MLSPKFFRSFDTLHFLVASELGQSPVSEEVEMSLGKRGPEQSRRFQDFVQRWRSDYLLQLQIKGKWFRQNKNPNKGEVVIVKDKSNFPSDWNIGRIVKTYPGTDGFVRIVNVKMKNGVKKRPIFKSVPLPYV